MILTDKTVLITGANRGIGAALVRAFLRQDIGQIYAGARNLSDLPDFGDHRVVPLRIDITKPSDVEAAAATVPSVDVLVNNAGVARSAEILSATVDDLTVDMNVNYYGTVRMMRTFAPLMERRGGIIANIVSVVGLASLPILGGYSASKAALFSATQAARNDLKSKNVRVIGIFPGPIDTDLMKDIAIEKASAADTAEEIVTGIIYGNEDIYPDPASKQISSIWSTNPKGLEEFFATMSTGGNS